MSAVATLTYVYADQTAVVGPLAGDREPHSYDLCERHAATLTAPRGWEIVRCADTSETSDDDLEALADVVRERPGRADRPDPAGTPGRRRPHLRVVPDAGH